MDNKECSLDRVCTDRNKMVILKKTYHLNKLYDLPANCFFFTSGCVPTYIALFFWLNEYRHFFQWIRIELTDQKRPVVHPDMGKKR
jgi:hypothetical protein